MFFFPLLSLGCFLATTPPDDAVQQELKKFEGTWVVTAFTIEGRQMTEAQLQTRLSFQFKGNKCISRQGKDSDSPGDEATFTIDPTKQPRTIDFTKAAGDGKGKTLRGIYEWKDGKLRLCYDRGGEKHPREFSEKAILVVLERERK